MTGWADGESVGSRREILLVYFSGAQVLHVMKAELAQQGRYLMGLKKELEGLASSCDTGSKCIQGGSYLSCERIRRHRVVEHKTRGRGQTRNRLGLERVPFARSQYPQSERVLEDGWIVCFLVGCAPNRNTPRRPAGKTVSQFPKLANSRVVLREYFSLLRGAAAMRIAALLTSAARSAMLLKCRRFNGLSGELGSFGASRRSR